MPKFNLSRWLFLEQANPAKDPGRFKAPEFFLVKTKDSVILVDSNGYEAAVREEAGDDWSRFLCGFAKLTEPDPAEDGKCYGTSFLSMIAANPRYPGAGYACCAFLSNAFRVPLTGDRDDSTTDAAKKTWTRIELDPDWEKVPLDNFFGDYGTSNISWVSFVGNWPDRKMKRPRNAPATPRKVDDCSLPGDDIRSVESLMGAVDGWIYTGSTFSSLPLEENGRVVISKLFPGNEKVAVESLTRQSRELFGEMYE